MRLTDVMKTDVVTISPTQTVQQARRLMDEQAIRHLVVFDQGVKGVLSDHDIHTIPVPGQNEETKEWIETTKVEEVMSSPATVLEPTDTVKKAANVMRGQKIGCVVIVDGEKLKGIVTETDLLEALSKKGTSSNQRPTVRARGNKRRR